MCKVDNSFYVKPSAAWTDILFCRSQFSQLTSKFEMKCVSTTAKPYILKHFCDALALKDRKDQHSLAMLLPLWQVRMLTESEMPTPVGQVGLTKISGAFWQWSEEHSLCYVLVQGLYHVTEYLVLEFGFSYCCC